MKNEIRKYRNNEEFKKDEVRIEKLYKEFKNEFELFEKKYPLKEFYWCMTVGDTIGAFPKYENEQSL